MLKWLNLERILIIVAMAAAGLFYVQLKEAREDLADLRVEVATKERQATERANADLLARTRNNERVQDEQDRRDAAVAAAAARAAGELIGLRDEIKRLNDRAMPADPRAAAFAGEARAARTALDECGREYQAVERIAQSLGSQVTGLQDFVTRVCRAGSEQPATAPPD